MFHSNRRFMGDDAMRRATLALWILGAAVVAGPVRGETITVQFTSTVTFVQNQPVLGITTSVGAPVSGQFTYERNAVDTNPGDPTAGFYGGGTVQLSIDGHPVIGSSSSVYVFDINAPNDLFGVADGTSQSGSPILVDGVVRPDGYLALNFTESTGTVFINDSLPTAAQIPLLEISQFNLGQEGTNGVIIYDYVTITGVFTNALKITSIADVGNDQGRQVRLRFTRAVKDAPGASTPISQYEAFRRLDDLPAPSLARVSGAEERLRIARRQGMVSDARILMEGWEFVRAIPAHGESTYSMTASTLADSTVESGVYWSAFFIRAATNDPYTFWDSAPDSGYSLDNLSPNVPASFVVAQRLANNDLVLAWSASTEADFRFYSLHRGVSPDFVPTGGNRVAALTENAYVDVGAGATLPVYYKLSATDFAGNQSAFAAASAQGVTGAEDALPIVFALTPITPNPANGASFVHFDLPRPSRISLRILDVSGRVVRALVRDEVLEAGTHRADWDGRSANGAKAPTGIYFYNLESEGRVRVRKLAVLD